jgi:hypothetical protein
MSPPATVAVDVEPGAEEADRLHPEPRLLLELAAERRLRLLALVDEAAEDVPLALLRLAGATSEEDTSVGARDDRVRGRHRMGVVARSAVAAAERAVVDGR